MQLILELKSLKKFQTLGPGRLFPSFYSLASYLHVLSFLAQTDVHLIHLLTCSSQLNWVFTGQGLVGQSQPIAGSATFFKTGEACKGPFGAEFQQKGTWTPRMAWHISAPASATIHRVGQWSPHSKASLPDPAPTLSMDFMGPLNEVIMCETPHGAFQVTGSHSSAFQPPHLFPETLHWKETWFKREWELWCQSWGTSLQCSFS